MYVCVPGRVHPAAVSGIDSDKCYVSVEWFENNETKGKEVSAHYLEQSGYLSGRTSYDLIHCLWSQGIWFTNWHQFQTIQFFENWLYQAE